jgi:hypothetical protein
MLLYQLRIELEGVNDPSVWREIQVRPDIMLDELHSILQGAMGWDKIHPHQYLAGEKKIGFVANSDEELITGSKIHDEKDVALMECLRRSDDQMLYTYDVWKHTIILQDVLSVADDVPNPIVINGDGACPPENCGGIWAYEELKHILENPKHEEHEDFCNLYGEDFDYDDFDMEIANLMIQKYLG